MVPVSLSLSLCGLFGHSSMITDHLDRDIKWSACALTTEFRSQTGENANNMRFILTRKYLDFNIYDLVEDRLLVVQT